MMDLENVISSHIRPANNRQELIHPDQSTDDIIQLIIKAFNMPEIKKDTEDFALLLTGSDVEETCHNIWKALKEHVRFVEDKAPHQYLRSPSRLWNDKEGDCKSMSLWLGSCLMNIATINFLVRFVSEKKDEPIHHVYIVAFDESGKEIVLDATLTQFNRELPYAYKKDFPITGSSVGAATETTGSNNIIWLLLLVTLGIALSSRN